MPERDTRLAASRCHCLGITRRPPPTASTSVEIDGNVATADVAIGSASATLTIRFENVVGLSAENLGLSAKLVDPLAPLASRLASGVSLPAALPLVVKISPPASGGLSFSGVVSVELYTHDLQFTVGSPFRLFSVARRRHASPTSRPASPAAASAPAAASRTSRNSSSRRTSARCRASSSRSTRSSRRCSASTRDMGSQLSQ